MRGVLSLLILGVAMAGCSRDGEIELVKRQTETRWRMVTTDQDRERLRNWRKAWVEALPRARAANPEAVAAQGALFEPDQALADALPPPGDYRCRSFKLGAQRADTSDFAVFPWFACRIGRNGEMPVLARMGGVQRFDGRLYAETRARVIFLGTLELADERTALTYGRDRKRDMAGYVERIGTARWRLVLPWPAFESQLEVVELVPG